MKAGRAAKVVEVVDKATGEIIDVGTEVVLHTDAGGTLSVLLSAQAVRERYPDIPEQVDYGRKLSALRKYVAHEGNYRQQWQAAVADLEAQVAHGETLADPALGVRIKEGRGSGNKLLPLLGRDEDKRNVKMLSARWQRMAAVGVTDRFAYYEQCQADLTLPTQAWLLKRGKELKWEQNIDLRKARFEAEAQPQAGRPATVTVARATDWIVGQPPADLILTDPPYFTEGTDFHRLIAACLKAVKPTGSAYVFIGASPEELLAYLSLDYQPLKLAQLLIWNYNNTGQRQPNTRYISNYQACLYLRGQEAGPLNKPSDGTHQYACQTVNAPDGRIGDRVHRWQKPADLIERLIRNSTQDGDVVLDPFCGSGTVLVTAAKLGRLASGCDLDPQAVELCVSRGCREV